MRTTLTLDPDVARLVADATHRERRSTKQIINDALRRGLSPAPAVPAEAFEVHPHHTALRAGVDLTGFNRLADELEDDAVIAHARPA